MFKLRGGTRWLKTTTRGVRIECAEAHLSAGAFLGGLIQELAVFEVFGALLQSADGLIEEDGQADSREVLSDAFLR